MQPIRSDPVEDEVEEVDEAASEVERLRDGHVPSMAFDLDVAPELVDAYRGMLVRLGNTTYLDPRMGDRQYLHSEKVA